jgi:hypothetical protein
MLLVDRRANRLSAREGNGRIAPTRRCRRRRAERKKIDDDGGYTHDSTKGLGQRLGWGAAERQQMHFELLPFCYLDNR